MAAEAVVFCHFFLKEYGEPRRLLTKNRHCTHGSGRTLVPGVNECNGLVTPTVQFSPDRVGNK